MENRDLTMENQKWTMERDIGQWKTRIKQLKNQHWTMTWDNTKGQQHGTMT